MELEVDYSRVFASVAWKNYPYINHCSLPAQQSKTQKNRETQPHPRTKFKTIYNNTEI